MKHIKKYSEKINEELFAMSTVGNIIKKKTGNYESPIWLHIKMFDRDEEITCFIENDWTGINDVNVLLMKKLNKYLNLTLDIETSTNRIKYEMVEPVCDFFRSLGLTITEHPKQGDTSQITINGKLSEKQIKDKLKSL